MENPALNVRDCKARLAFVPRPVEVLGRGAKLDHQVAREVFWLDFAALFLPEPQQRHRVVAHDGPGVTAADEGAAVEMRDLLL
ncbi:hypothetical protein ACVIQY_000718 [Bradyrhizobium sp. USDA 3051]